MYTQPQIFSAKISMIYNFAPPQIKRRSLAPQLIGKPQRQNVVCGIPRTTFLEIEPF